MDSVLKLLDSFFNWLKGLQTETLAWFDEILQQLEGWDRDLPGGFWPMFFLGLSGIILAIPSWLLARHQRKWPSKPDEGVYLSKVTAFDPKRIIPTYNARSVTTYLPVLSDAELEEGLRSKHHLLVVGRPGIGKSHSVINAVKKVYPDWTIVLPTRRSIQSTNAPNIARKKCILILDDIDKFIRETDIEAGVRLLDFIDELCIHSRETIVIATIRSQLLDSDVINEQLEVFRFYRHITVNDWENDQGEELAHLTGTDFSLWDKTPLSVKYPSQEIMLKLQHTQEYVKMLSLAIKRSVIFGLNPLSKSSLQAIYTSPFVEGDKLVFSAALEELKEIGFVSIEEEKVECYDAYVDQINDPADYEDEVLSLAKLFLSENALLDAQVLAEWAVDRALVDVAFEISSLLLEQSAEDANVWYLMGRVAGRRGDSVEALRCYHKAADRRPGWATCWWRLSMTYQKLERTEEAQAMIGRAVAVRSGQPTWNRTAAIVSILRESGQFEDAIHQVEDYEKNNAADFTTSILLGQLYNRVERWDLSKQKFLAALEENDQLAFAYFGLGGAYNGLKEWASAETALRTGLSLSGNSEIGALALTHALLAQRKLNEARSMLLDAVLKFPGSYRIHSYLGSVYNMLRSHKEAIPHFETALKIYADYPEALAGVAGAYRHEGREEEAIQANSRALELDPRLASAHFGMGFIYWKKEEPDKALESFSKVTELEPANAAAHYYLGKMLVNSNKFDKAIESLREAEKLGYSLGKLNYELAKVYASLNYVDDAVKALTIASENGFEFDSRLKKNYYFKTIRDHPKFLSLVGA